MATSSDRLRAIGDDIDELLIKQINATLVAAEQKAEDPDELDAYLVERLPELLGTVRALQEAAGLVLEAEQALRQGGATEAERDDLITSLAGLTDQLRPD